MKYIVIKRNYVSQMIAWLGIIAFGLMNLCIVWGCWMDPTLMTGPVIAMFFLWLIVIIFSIFSLQYATRPKVIVKGDEIIICEFLKKKKTISLRRINGRFTTPYTEESSEKNIRNGLRGVPGKRMIAKLIASTEKWKNEYMEKMVYYSNGVEVLTIHTGMKNGARLDCEIVESLENNWGYEYDGGSIMGVVPTNERIQVTAANLRHFTSDNEAEKFLKKNVQVDASAKVLTFICLIGFILFAIDYWKTHFISNEITPYMLLFFGAFAVIMACVWLLLAYTKKKSIQILKERQEIRLAADQLYSLGGLDKKEHKLKITPDFVFSNFASAIVPLDEIIWVYTKNSEYANELCVGTKDGRMLSVGSYKIDSGAQAAAAYNILEEYLSEKNILWGFNPRNQAIYNKITGRNV